MARRKAKKRRRLRWLFKRNPKISHALAKRQPTGYIDYTLILLLVLLLGVGFVMLYSTSSYSSYISYGNSFYYIKRQFIFALIGFGAMIVISHVDYHISQKHPFAFYFFSLALVLSVYVVGRSSNGSARWLRIGGIGFQPSELAKSAVIVLTAFFIARFPRSINHLREQIVFAIPQLLLALCIAKENLSTAIIVAGITYFMYLIASRQKGIFAILLGIGAIGVLLLIAFGGAYRMARLNVWLHPELSASGDGYQTMQALYAIGSGGLFGKGLGESMQKQFIPEAQNDMIFSVITEELGIFGAVALIVLYLIFIWRLSMIAIHAKDLFGSMLAAGIAIHMGLQVFMNIAVVTNSMPNTGVTLPFISYGGSALLVTLAEMGIALSVSRQARPGLDLS